MKKLKEQGVPIHGVGLQTHITVGDNLSTFQANLERFTALGVEVAITEMDDKIRLPSNANTLEQQGRDYATIFKACVAVRGCAGITLWGFTDKYSWIPGAAPGWGDALIFDKNYKPKPAYSAIENVLH